MSVALGRSIRVNRSGQAWSVAWGFVDQVFSSLTNFGLFLVAGRLLGPAGLGVVFVGFSSYLVALGFQRALVTDPLVASSAGRGPVTRLRMTRCGLTTSMLGASAAGAVLATFGLVVPGPLGRGLLLFAPWLVAALVQDFWRAVLFRDGRAVAATANDGVWLLVMGLSFPLAWFGRSEWPIVVCWGAGALVSASLGFFQARVRPAKPLAGLGWWRSEAWPFGRWLGLNSVLYSLGSYATIFVLAGLLGAGPLGGLRAIESIFAPLSLIIPALALPGLPAVTRALAVSFAAARRLALQLGAVATGATLLYVLVLSVGREQVLPLVFGQSFSTFTNLVWPVGGGQIISSTALAFGLVLKAQRRGRELLLSGAVGAVATLGLSAGLASQFGVLGAAWGLAGGSAVGALAMMLFAISGPAGSRRRPRATGAAMSPLVSAPLPDGRLNERGTS